MLFVQHTPVALFYLNVNAVVQYIKKLAVESSPRFLIIAGKHIFTATVELSWLNGNMIERVYHLNAKYKLCPIMTPKLQ